MLDYSFTLFFVYDWQECLMETGSQSGVNLLAQELGFDSVERITGIRVRSCIENIGAEDELARAAAIAKWNLRVAKY